MAALFAKIISGGQTGVDRAALDVALELSIPCGGWCPKGRRAEDGPIDDRYPLMETPWWGYPQRTEWNVRDADGTLILVRGEPDRGTRLTMKLAERLQKPFLVIQPTGQKNVAALRTWAKANRIGILNIAGPRESQNAGIYAEVCRFLRLLFRSAGPKRQRGRRRPR